MTDKILSLEEEKAEAIDIAYDLQYGKKAVKEIIKANSISEVYRIMMRYRKEL